MSGYPRSKQKLFDHIIVQTMEFYVRTMEFYSLLYL